MSVNISSAPVALRLMTERDLPMLHDWLNRPHVVDWWGGERPSMDEVRAHYMPRILAVERVTPYVAMLGDVPFAYAQSYVALGSGDGWWEDETDPGVRGIDQSIGEAHLLGKGLGTKLVRALVERLFKDPSVTKVQTDPAPTNLRAIRCYEKAGFESWTTSSRPTDQRCTWFSTGQPAINEIIAKRREARMKKTEANEGKSASTLISERIAELGDWRGETLATMRKLIKETDPDVVEEWKWMGTPVWSHEGILCTGETYKDKVKLTFAKGASLKDPKPLFNSSLDGNMRRAIDIHEGEAINAAAFKALIREAIAINRAGKSKKAK